MKNVLLIMYLLLITPKKVIFKEYIDKDKKVLGYIKAKVKREYKYIGLSPNLEKRIMAGLKFTF